jgi:hypothetical protein
MACFAKTTAYNLKRRMKISFKLFGLIAIGLLLAVVPLRADEKGSSIGTGLNSSTLSGYADTSIHFNPYPPASLVRVPQGAYTEWLIQKRQSALLAFNREVLLTHNFWGNPYFLQQALRKYHLSWFPGGYLGSLGNPITYHPAGYAYLDSPGGFAGPDGTFMFSDHTAWRIIQSHGFLFPLKPVRTPNFPTPPPSPSPGPGHYSGNPLNGR